MTKHEIEKILNEAIDFAHENGNEQLKHNLVNVLAEVQYNLIGADDAPNSTEVSTVIALYDVVKSMCCDEVSANKPIMALLPNGESIQMTPSFYVVDNVFVSTIDTDNTMTLTPSVLVSILNNENQCDSWGYFDRGSDEYSSFGDYEVRFINGSYDDNAECYHIVDVNETDEALIFVMKVFVVKPDMYEDGECADEIMVE